MRAAVAEGAEDRLRVAELALKRLHITLGHLLRNQNSHLARAIGNRAEDQVETEGGDMEALERHDARRKTMVPAMREHRRASLARIVKEDARIFAARFAIRGEQRLQPHAEIRHRR